MYKNKVNYKLLNILILSAILYLAVITSNYWIGIILRIFKLVFPFILAFIIAYAFSPIVRKIEEKGVRRNLAVTIVVLSVVLLFVGMTAITIPIVYDQLVSLSKSMGTIINDLSKTFNIDISEYQPIITEYLNNIIGDLGQYISNGIMSFISSFVDFFSKFIIVFIVSIYFLADMENIRKNVKLYLRKENKSLLKLASNIDHDLGGYLEGLITFMVIQFFEYSLLFWIVGHPNWALLGVLACITTVIPYFGGWITNIIAVILASVVGPKVFIATLIICFIFPNIDGYIISPRVYGRATNVKPLWSIFAVTVMGGLFGMFGILIALPSFLIIRCIFNHYKERFKEAFDKIDDKIEKIEKKKD